MLLSAGLLMLLQLLLCTGKLTETLIIFLSFRIHIYSATLKPASSNCQRVAVPHDKLNYLKTLCSPLHSLWFKNINSRFVTISAFVKNHVGGNVACAT